MLIFRKAQNAELLTRMFHAKLYRFLLRNLPPRHRARMGSPDAMASFWSSVPWVEKATEHDLAVYMIFAWVTTFDEEAARRMLPPEEALGTRENVIKMKSYMVDAGMFDIAAFERG